MKEGTKRLATETGAGQWGSSLAMACSFFGLECKVFVVRVSCDQKPYRRALMEAYRATVTPSPSQETASGRAILADHPDSTGSLGIAISEAVEVAAHDPLTKYSLGSVLNHVLLHQTVIGLEAMEQMEMAGEFPDVLVGCTGGGSNFSGMVFRFLRLNLRGQRKTRVVAVEPAACPSLAKGRFAYDFGDTGHLTPLVKMHTLGSTFVPPRFSRRWTALSWNGATREPPARPWSNRSQSSSAIGCFCGRCLLRPGRGYFASARGQSRRGRRGPGGFSLQGGGDPPHDSIQPLRSWPF